MKWFKLAQKAHEMHTYHVKQMVRARNLKDKNERRRFVEYEHSQCSRWDNVFKYCIKRYDADFKAARPEMAGPDYALYN